MKDKRFELRLDEELKLFIHEASEELGCSASSFVRDRIYSPEYYKISLDYDSNLESCINRVGNNINQIARNLNTLMDVFTGNEEQLLKESKGVISSLKRVEELLLVNRKEFENILLQKQEANKELFKIVLNRKTYSFLMDQSDAEEEDTEWHM